MTMSPITHSASPSPHAAGCLDSGPESGDGTPPPRASQPTGKQCPVCDRELLLKNGRRGAFLSCSGFPECRYSVNPDEPIKPPPPEHACPACGAPMRKRHGRHGAFYGCAKYPDCTETMELDGTKRAGRDKPAHAPRPADLACPLCSSEMLEHDGPTGAYLRCTSDDCRKTLDRQGLEEATGATCHECGALMVVREAHRGRFLGCLRYPQCRASRDLDSSPPSDPSDGHDAEC